MYEYVSISGVALHTAPDEGLPEENQAGERGVGDGDGAGAGRHPGLESPGSLTREAAARMVLGSLKLQVSAMVGHGSHRDFLICSSAC